MSRSVESSVLTDREAAQYIGMSESWLRISRMKGSREAPPFLKIGRSVRYRQQDLDHWLESRIRFNTLS